MLSPVRGLVPPLCFVLMLFLMATDAYAKTQTNQISGAYLHTLCEIDDKGREKVKGGHTACQAYIAGVLDYHRMLQSMKLAPELKICVPKTTSLNDLHRIVLVYLRKRIEHDSFIAAPAVTMALYQVFPCK